jgi:hypothetical protein
MMSWPAEIAQGRRLFSARSIPASGRADEDDELAIFYGQVNSANDFSAVKALHDIFSERPAP